MSPYKGKQEIKAKTEEKKKTKETVSSQIQKPQISNTAPRKASPQICD